jgi:ABC-type multidrug transport system fused ATPase/permease subunit
LLGATALLTASQLLRLTMPWLAAQGIDALQSGDIAHAGRWIAALAGIYLVSWLVHGPGRILERNVGLRVREALADALYARIAAAPLVWHDGHHSGELQHRVHRASRTLSDFAQNQFIYLTNIVNFIGPLVALTLLSHASGAVAIGGYVVIAVIIVRFDRALMRLAHRERRRPALRRGAARLPGQRVDGDRPAPVGRLARPAAAAHAGDLRAAQAHRGAERRQVVRGRPHGAGADLGTGGGLCLAGTHAGQAVMLGAVFMIYQYAQQAASVVTSMAANFQFFARMHTDYSSAAPIRQAPSRTAEPAREGIDRDARWHMLDVQALVWNLGFGQPCDDAALQVALHVSTFDEVLRATHGDLDTALSERGFNLSGGERQRLCLARGVLAAQGSSLLLLDEPTSALDAATEGRALEHIAAAFPDACVIASIHRLSLLERFATVVLMEAGRIVDAGPRDAVMARQPLLQKLAAPGAATPA